MYGSASCNVCDGDFDVHAGLDGDGRDLLDDLRWGVQVDEALVDTHLEPIPRVGSFTAWGLARRDHQTLGWHADGTLDAEIFRLGAADQVGAHLLQVLHMTGRQRDADLVHRRRTRVLLVTGPPGLHGHGVKKITSLKKEATKGQQSNKRRRKHGHGHEAKDGKKKWLKMNRILERKKGRGCARAFGAPCVRVGSPFSGRFAPCSVLESDRSSSKKASQGRTLSLKRLSRFHVLNPMDEKTKMAAQD